VVAADRLGHLPLWEARVEAGSLQVLAHGLGVLGVARGPGFASAEGDAAEWHLMHATPGLCCPFAASFGGSVKGCVNASGGGLLAARS
jgi:hypothetical protein